MRLGKVNGTTQTRFRCKDTSLVREIKAHPVFIGNHTTEEAGAPLNPIPIIDLSLKNSKVLIRQWISTIDKVFSKPKTGNPSEEQFEHRSDLGEACWDKLVAENLVELNQADYWKQRLHPYGTSTPYSKNSKPGLKGHWHWAFTQDGNDYSQIARRIYMHLHERELRQDGHFKFGEATSGRSGSIANRATGIEQSVFNPNLIPRSVSHWSNDDEDYYCKNHDVAESVLSGLADKGRWKFFKPPLPLRKQVGMLLAEHLERVTGSKRCSSLDHGSNGLDTPKGVLNLHNSVRAHYKRLVGGRSRNRTEKFPKNTKILLSQLQQRRANQMTNSLVRIGRIAKYSGNLNAIDKSDFWLSLGQAQMKETEAFVRVWRGAISQGARAIKAWVDPDGTLSNTLSTGTIDDDITSSKNIVGFLGAHGLHEDAIERAALYFGSSAAIANLDQSEKIQLANACMRHLQSCRNNIFHFKDRAELVITIQKRLAYTKWGEEKLKQEVLGEATKTAILSLFHDDRSSLMDRILKNLQGALVDRFGDNQQFRELFNAIQHSAIADSNDVILPGFKRLLRRTGDLKKHIIGLEDDTYYKVADLPPEPNLDDLKDPATNARYVGLQALYEGPFRRHIDSMDAASLTPFIDMVNNTTTQLAQSANSQSAYPEAIKARSENLPPMVEDDTIIRYFSRLVQITAQEFEVQKGYEPDATKAKAQAQFIENFKRDFIALAFDSYLTDNDFRWVAGIEASQNACNDTPKPPEIAQCPDDTEPWQAGLYIVLHFIPFDDVSRLLHQFKRWGALQGKLALADAETAAAESQVERFRKTLTLYLKMHDGKIQGDESDLDVTTLRGFYSDAEKFNKVFLVDAKSGDQNDFVAQTRKGLRNILKFNHLPSLSFIFSKRLVTNAEVDELKSLETIKADGLSDIQRAHRDRAAIHKAVTEHDGIKSISLGDLQTYRSSLKIIERHKALVGRVFFGDHVRLHRLMMMVIARLVDFAGLWERDCKPDTGFIATAVKYLNTEKDADIGWNDPGGDAAVKIRDNIDHFNILAAGAPRINLTHLINQVRTLMQYDRKLKNAVTKSVIEMMAREGIDLAWDMKDHQLTGARIWGRNIQHFKRVKDISHEVIEQRHNRAFLEMVAVLFDGQVKEPPFPKAQNKHGHSDRTKARTKPMKRHAGNPGVVPGQRISGTVKWFNSTKGFGFIVPDGGGPDSFVHISAVERAGMTTLKDNQRVSYEIEIRKNGNASAIKLRPE